MISLESECSTDLRFEPDHFSRIQLPWMHVAAFCKYMYGATQRGFVGKYQGVLMSASGAMIYVSLMDAADRPLTLGTGG